MPKVFSPLQYRRDRAVIAFKESVLIGPLIDSVNAAVRSATRVRITDDIVEAAMRYINMLADDEPAFQDGLQAAFEAAGFEVID